MSDSKDKNNDNELAASESLIQPAGLHRLIKAAAKKLGLNLFPLFCPDSYAIGGDDLVYFSAHS